MQDSVSINLQNKETFVANGFDVFSLAKTAHLDELKQEVLALLKQKVSVEIELENYHQFVADDELHKQLQFEVFQLLANIGLHKRLILDNQSLFEPYFGPDIDIQVKPYIRIARPACPQDNIGFHWDTFYGNSAFETSCVLPLTENSTEGVLQLAPGSHRWETPDFVQQQSEEVEKGSPQNQMGFLYAPKVIKELDYSKVHPILVKPGQALLFSLGVLHGQEVNNDSVCRWSMDFRLKNAFAPVSKNLKAGYYQELSRSAISDVSKQYYANKAEEKSMLTLDF